MSIDSFGRILVVEDMRNMRNALERALTDEGYVVSTAKNAKEAIELVVANDETPFDFVVMDIKMPGELDGVQAATAIKEHSPSTPIAFFTGYFDDPAVMREIRESNAKYELVIEKGNREVLIQMLEASLKKSAIAQNIEETLRGGFAQERIEGYLNILLENSSPKTILEAIQLVRERTQEDKNTNQERNHLMEDLSYHTEQLVRSYPIVEVNSGAKLTDSQALRIGLIVQTIGVLLSVALIYFGSKFGLVTLLTSSAFFTFSIYAFQMETSIHVLDRRILATLALGLLGVALSGLLTFVLGN